MPGDLSIRSVKFIAAPVFLAFVSKAKQLPNRLISLRPTCFPDHHSGFHSDDRSKNNQLIQPPACTLLAKQKSWDIQ